MLALDVAHAVEVGDRRLRQRLATVPYVTLCYSAAAVFLWMGTQAFAVPLRGYAWSTFGIFLLLALVPQMIGHTSFNWALKHLSAPTIAVTLRVVSTAENSSCMRVSHSSRLSSLTRRQSR